MPLHERKYVCVIPISKKISGCGRNARGDPCREVSHHFTILSPDSAEILVNQTGRNKERRDQHRHSNQWIHKLFKRSFPWPSPALHLSENKQRVARKISDRESAQVIERQVRET